MYAIVIFGSALTGACGADLEVIKTSKGAAPFL